MEAQEAAQAAKDYVRLLFESEGVANIGLEEIEYERDENVWKVTIGFNRDWERQGALGSSLGLRGARAYKVLRLRSRDGKVQSVRDRVLPAVTS